MDKVQGNVITGAASAGLATIRDVNNATMEKVKSFNQNSFGSFLLLPLQLTQQMLDDSVEKLKQIELLQKVSEYWEIFKKWFNDFLEKVHTTTQNV